MKNILSKGEINHINDVCKEYRIINYKINSDGSIDVDGNVYFYAKKLDKLPLKFGKVSGNFYCDDNDLISLVGCPSSVGGSFYCYANELTSLEGCPSSVGDDFKCFSNQLTSLEGCPKSIGGDFNCFNNKLTSLKGCPSYVGGYFDCNFNHLPDHFMDVYQNLNKDELKIFLKYQHDLRIWEDEYNDEEAQMLYEEIKDGMR